MATSDISICSASLLLIGDEDISALPGDTRRGRVCANIYENTKLMLLSSHPWRFSITQAQLSQLVSTPLFAEFTFAYQLPADFHRIIRTENDTAFKIYKNLLYSNANTLNLEYQFTPDEKDLPAYFVRTLELKLAALLSVAISENSSKATLYNDLYEEQLRAAKAADNQSIVSSAFDTSTLIKVR